MWKAFIFLFGASHLIAWSTAFCLQTPPAFGSKVRLAKSLNHHRQATTSSFLPNIRLSTQLAAATSEDRTKEGGKRAVSASYNEAIWLGSMATAPEAPATFRTGSSSSKSERDSSNNRILIVADTAHDPMAKALIPAFSDLMKQILPDTDIKVLEPSTTLSQRGNNAACVVVFTTSLSDRSSLTSLLGRLLSRTVHDDGSIASPPTQIVAVSTLGTSRINKLPYSMQNLMGGGKLDHRQQMEEAIISLVQQRANGPPLDYTICKFGDILDSGKHSEFHLFPGDTLDGTTSLEVASHVLLQAVAYQPAARNATLCATGGHAPSDQEREVWEDAFLCLDGPEILRLEKVATKNLDESYGRLVEYIKGWGVMLAESGKGLTTPIQAFLPSSFSRQGARVKERERMQLLFLPTHTGKYYRSFDEEAATEDETREGKKIVLPTRPSKMAQDGGVEVVVERTTLDEIRVRVKRCNYANDATIKELSESTILSRLRDAIAVWKRDQHQP